MLLVGSGSAHGLIRASCRLNRKDRTTDQPHLAPAMLGDRPCYAITIRSQAFLRRSGALPMDSRPEVQLDRSAIWIVVLGVSLLIADLIVFWSLA